MGGTTEPDRVAARPHQDEPGRRVAGTPLAFGPPLAIVGEITRECGHVVVRSSKSVAAVTPQLQALVKGVPELSLGSVRHRGRRNTRLLPPN